MAARRYRIRVVTREATCVAGSFATLEAAAQAQDTMRAAYAAHAPDTLTVLEAYTPTRPVYEKVQALLAVVRAEVGETDPILRTMAGEDPSAPLLAIYAALVESVAELAQIVYDEEGRYEPQPGPPTAPYRRHDGKSAQLDNYEGENDG